MTNTYLCAKLNLEEWMRGGTGVNFLGITFFAVGFPQVEITSTSVWNHINKLA